MSPNNVANAASNGVEVLHVLPPNDQYSVDGLNSLEVVTRILLTTATDTLIPKAIEVRRICVVDPPTTSFSQDLPLKVSLSFQYK